MEPDGHGFLASKEQAASPQPWLVLLVLVSGQRAGIEDDDEDEEASL